MKRADRESVIVAIVVAAILIGAYLIARHREDSARWRCAGYDERLAVCR